MNTLYITQSGQVLLDENNGVQPKYRDRTSVDDVYYLEEDTKVVFKKGDINCELEGKAGDIVVTFYESKFPNRVIIVNNKEWSENLTTYRDLAQKEKENWAAQKLAESKWCAQCDTCDQCSPA